MIQNTLGRLMRACDIVFGSVMVSLGIIGIWLLLAEQARPTTIAAVWALPAVNLIWSMLTRNSDRVKVDLIRSLLCLPITVFLYLAEPGLLERLWIPAMLMSVGASLTLTIGSRNTSLGQIITIAYAAALCGAAAVHKGGFDIIAFVDALGIGLTGCMLSIVGAKLGRSLEEAQHQRDHARAQKTRAETLLTQLSNRSNELTAALQSLHGEMEHRLRVEVELRQAQKLEAIGRLAAGVAHEIKTPVQFVTDSIQFVRNGVTEMLEVIGKLEVVQRSVLAGTPSHEAAAEAAEAAEAADLEYLADNLPQALDRALHGLDRIAVIVRSMKEFAHPGSGEMQASDLNHAIESTLTMARHEYHCVAELETELGELPPVRCFIGELNQVVLNIVVNAAHAIGDAVQGTTARGRIHVRSYREGEDVVITIADTGNGIPEHARARIFDPFFTTKEVGRGTGQGLAIAHAVIVDKHHGRLDFETELGKGTTFLIRLPIDGVRTAHADAA